MHEFPSATRGSQPAVESAVVLCVVDPPSLKAAVAHGLLLTPADFLLEAAAEKPVKDCDR